MMWQLKSWHNFFFMPCLPLTAMILPHQTLQLIDNHFKINFVVGTLTLGKVVAGPNVTLPICISLTAMGIGRN